MEITFNLQNAVQLHYLHLVFQTFPHIGPDVFHVCRSELLLLLHHQHPLYHLREAAAHQGDAGRVWSEQRSPVGQPNRGIHRIIGPASYRHGYHFPRKYLQTTNASQHRLLNRAY